MRIGIKYIRTVRPKASPVPEKRDLGKLNNNKLYYLRNLSKKNGNDMTEFRIGQGYDVHQIREGLPMWLCGVRIPSETGFVAHSDGDVALHALCDAMLGALALGDIGHLFPDTDPAYKGISSILLLKEVALRVRDMGYVPANIDITIALQAPKLAPYIIKMREEIARALDIDVSKVSVKATTTERLGFVGRGEGCEVWAVVLLEKIFLSN